MSDKSWLAKFAGLETELYNSIEDNTKKINKNFIIMKDEVEYNIYHGNPRRRTTVSLPADDIEKPDALERLIRQFEDDLES